MKRILVAVLSLLCFSAFGATLTVAPTGAMYTKPCKAFAAAQDGDRIEITKATYYRDMCYINRSGLTIVGVGGRPIIDGGFSGAAEKGLWVIAGNDTTVDNVEFKRAMVPDANGAGIRLEGKNLTVLNSYFHHNENGILTSNDGVSNIVIKNSHFAFNGAYDGQSHNVYIGSSGSLVFMHNFSHDARVGHLVKSRAKSNLIAYNRLTSGGTAAPSYEIDLPSGGAATIIGNVIVQPLNNNNNNIIAYGQEDVTSGDGPVYIGNNTIINNDTYGGTTYFVVGPRVKSVIATQNNALQGDGTENIAYPANKVSQITNMRVKPSAFVAKSRFDFNPRLGSPLINAGTPPAAGYGYEALFEYVHVATSAARPVNGAIDIGAYESD